MNPVKGHFSIVQYCPDLARRETVTRRTTARNIDQPNCPTSATTPCLGLWNEPFGQPLNDRLEAYPTALA